MGEKTPCYSKLDRKGFPLPWIPSNSLVKKVRGEITALCAAEANNTAKKNLTPSLWPRLDLLHGF